jgi:hypothetical protein
LGIVTVVVLIIFFARRIRRLGWVGALRVWTNSAADESSKVEFYEALLRLLEKRGFKREAFQTPLEFAAAVPLPEALLVTRVYNRVRFGGRSATAEELAAINSAMRRLGETRSQPED